MRAAAAVGLGLILVSGVAASFSDVRAACSDPRRIRSVNASGSSFIYTPGGPWPYTYTSVTYYHHGVFWSLGGGDPALGSGNDAGSNRGWGTYYGGAGSWLRNYGSGATGYRPYIGGGSAHWQTSGTDGCIDFDGSDPAALDKLQCMVVLLEDAPGRLSYFALLSQGANVFGDYEFNLAAGNGPILLAPVPRPRILDSTRDLLGNVTVEVGIGAVTLNPLGGFYLNCNSSAQDASILKGYGIYSQMVPFGDLPADSRLIEEWNLEADGIEIGMTTTLDFGCNGNESIYLCTRLEFESGFRSTFCSRDSVRIDCGPTIADPGEELAPSIGKESTRAPTSRGRRSPGGR